MLDTQRDALTWTDHPTGGTLELAWPTAPADLAVEHAGTGAPWVTVETRAAVPLRAPLASGYRVTKHVEPLEVGAAGYVDRRRPPAGPARGRGPERHELGGARRSRADRHVAPRRGRGRGRPRRRHALPPDFVERSFASWRAYYGWVPAGRFTAAYTIRLNQAGTFELPPTRVEAMYAPDLFGEAPNATVGGAVSEANGIEHPVELWRRRIGFVLAPLVFVALWSAPLALATAGASAGGDPGRRGGAVDERGHPDDHDGAARRRRSRWCSGWRPPPRRSRPSPTRSCSSSSGRSCWRARSSSTASTAASPSRS